jgi:hypothetical protein
MQQNGKSPGTWESAVSGLQKHVKQGKYRFSLLGACTLGGFTLQDAVS